MGRVDDRGHAVARRGAAVAAAIILAFGAAACGDDDDDEAVSDAPAVTQTEPAAPPAEEPAEEPADEGGETAAAGDASAGEQVFAENCASCHGDQGAGGSGGPSLQTPSLAERADHVSRQVTDGGSVMPAFGGTLSDEEIANVTAYVVEELAAP